MREQRALAALDIETTGLDPAEDQVRAVAVVVEDEERVFVSDDEGDILRSLESLVDGLTADVLIVTWNGEEFDLPFLAERYRRLGLNTSINLTPTGRQGKYGRELFRGNWGQHAHVDIAPMYREEAAVRDIHWSLKPVARAILGIEPVEVDRRGSAIRDLSTHSLAEYVLSDARVTAALADRLDFDAIRA